MKPKHKDPSLNAFFIDRAKIKRLRRASKPSATKYAKANVR